MRKYLFNLFHQASAVSHHISVLIKINKCKQGKKYIPNSVGNKLHTNKHTEKESNSNVNH